MLSDHTFARDSPVWAMGATQCEFPPRSLRRYTTTPAGPQAVRQRSAAASRPCPSSRVPAQRRPTSRPVVWTLAGFIRAASRTVED